MSQVPNSKRTYPWVTTINGKQLSFRLGEPKDFEGVLAFAKSLPENDLLFLSSDITNPDELKQLLDSIAEDRTRIVFVEIDGRIAGYCSLNYNQVHWKRHMGEIWLMVSSSQRGRGLGKMLVNEIFGLAEELGLDKIIAQMAADQKGAIQVFELLGFKAEALLADHVIDRKGQTHDLVVMSYDVTGHSE